MKTYIYSKWHNSPAGCPSEFYSELDSRRFETRKIELFSDGRKGFSDGQRSTEGTRLGIEPVPPVDEIRSQPEFSINVISAKDFEQKWKEITSRR